MNDDDSPADPADPMDSGVTDVVIDVSDPAVAVGAVRELVSDGDYAEAISLGQLAIERFAADGDSLVLGRLESALASAHQCVGDVDAAAAAADRAIAALERGPGSDPGELGVALHCRAVAHLFHGGLEEATPLLDRAAQALEGAGKPSRADFLSVLLTMAEVAAASGASDEALALDKRVLDEIAAIEPASEEHAGELNRLTGRAFLGLGSTYARRGETDPAKDLLARAVEFFDAGYGHGHPEMTAALEEVAAIYRAIGDDDAAAAIEEELGVEPS